MSTSSDIRDIEVNVVSSPESNSRTGSPEPDSFRILKHVSTSNITCFPVIKTSDDEKDSKDNTTQSKGTTSQKNCGGSTNFSISSILSRNEPSANKKNGFLGVQTGQTLLDSGISPTPDSAMLSRYFNQNYLKQKKILSLKFFLLMLFTSINSKRKKKVERYLKKKKNFYVHFKGHKQFITSY